MTEKKRSTPTVWNDSDDAPQLTAAFFKSADLYEGTKIKARGRPKALTTKIKATGLKFGVSAH